MQKALVETGREKRARYKRCTVRSGCGGLQRGPRSEQSEGSLMFEAVRPLSRVADQCGRVAAVQQFSGDDAPAAKRR